LYWVPPCFLVELFVMSSRHFRQVVTPLTQSLVVFFTKSWTVTTVVEEASRWLCKLDNACEQMSFKISHVELGSEGSTPGLVKDVAKNCVKGGTTCLKCLDDMTKLCMERYVDNIEYESRVETCANNDASYDIEYKSREEKCAHDVQYESKQKSLEYLMVDTTKSCIEYEGQK
jgi:hypothetical protein